MKKKQGQCIKQIKNNFIQLRETLDNIEKDLDSEDNFESLGAIYYGTALIACLNNIADEIDKLSADEIDKLSDKIAQEREKN